MTMNSFKLTWEVVQSFPIIYLDGDITLDAKELLEETYNSIMDQLKTKILILDFSKIYYINSSGISSLLNILRLHYEISGELIFTGLSDHLKKVLDIVGLIDHVKDFETIEMAIQYCKNEL